MVNPSDSKALEAQLQRRVEELTALHQIAVQIGAQLNLEALLSQIARSAAELLSADTGAILLLDEKGETLTIEGAFGLSEKVVKGTRDLVGESIAGRVVQIGEPIIANDLPNDSRFYNPSAAEEGLLAIVSTPMFVRNRIIGTLDVHSKTQRQAFNEDHLRILSLLANQAAIAIDNSRLFEEMNRALEELRAANEEQRRLLETIRTLSTPVVSVTDEILVVPLVGSIDTQRAQQIMETMLEGIGHHQADTVIVDITGVPVVDTSVANHLLHTARAARLLGAQVILTGISPHVAQTIVELGIDLSDVVTRRSLQQGIAYAMGGK